MATTKQHVGVIGATSLVGRLLLPQLVSTGYEVKAFTRDVSDVELGAGIDWQRLGALSKVSQLQHEGVIMHWICVAPLHCLPNYFSLLEAYGVRRIVALSSTSRFVKVTSPDVREREISQMLVDAEEVLVDWAERNRVEWVILRPTLIYGLGQDKNVSEIARFIGRFGFFPLVGKAHGLRQPVHAADVANACKAVLVRAGVANRAYNISGGETITYREMVARIFAVLNRSERALPVPLWAFNVSIFFLRLLPRYRHWTVSMAMRMNQDLVFDHSDATRDFSYKPRLFSLGENDMLAK